jgi:DNA-binding response OmpR family regulator
MRLLLVDDDREVAEYVRRELEDESFTVVVAHDGATGLRLAESSPFDILLLDVIIPFTDGLELTRAPQTLGGDPSLHVHTMYWDPTNDYGRRFTTQ